jgi:hypothetical protein
VAVELVAVQTLALQEQAAQILFFQITYKRKLQQLVEAEAEVTRLVFKPKMVVLVQEHLELVLKQLVLVLADKVITEAVPTQVQV